jgi:surfactin family lipopeptide synthetase A
MIHRYDRDRDDGLAVPIGRPSGNVRIYILDKKRNPLPLGTVGEIYIAGEGVARGYLDNDQLTGEKFVDDPFVAGEKMYRSGDLGRWNLDKVLEFYGRGDEQVKIRGYRIEPGEIEKQLIKIEGIKDAVVVLGKGPQADLCAYIVAEGQKEFEVSELRELLSRELPVYMLPAEFVQVESIPLTRNGKVDSRKLETMGKKLESRQEYAAPRDEMETMLAEIWAGVLGAERVGINDNFFELGGDSIKAVQIAARLNDAGKTVNVKDVLSRQTIANLCANVDFDSHIRKYEQGTIAGEKGPTPIESWFLAQGFHDPDHYHQSVLLEFKTPVDIPVLEKVFEELIAHHDGLRLNYNKEKDLFYFNNDLMGKSFKIDVVDLSAVPGAERAAQIETRGYEAKGGFDITDGLMLRAVLFKAEPERDRLLLILHHLVTDGLTWRIILEEFYNFYEVLHRRKELDLPQKTASLPDWYDALLMYRESGKLDKEKEYWQQAGAVDFRLPYDREPGGVDWRVKNQAVVNARLDQEQTVFLLKDAHDVYKSDVQILVFAALVRTLRQWTGKRTVAIEMESHGRHIDDIDTSKTIGWFTAIYPVLVNRDDRTIGDEIKSVKEAIRKTPGSGIGYGILKYMSEAGKSMETKRAEVRFNYLGQFHGEVENPLFSYCRQSTGADVALENHMTAAVEINAMILNGVFTADINYNKEAFDESTMVSFAGNYIKSLEEILEHIRNEDDVHFTPSDFDTVDLGEDDLAALFE